MSADTTPIRVLIVDDQEPVAETTASLLTHEESRIKPTSAVSAAAGLDILADESVDCIVSDFDMPGTDGIEFLEAVRERYPTLPFILFTGKGSEEVAADAISAGATDYLQKGSGSDQYTILANRVVQAVERRRASVAAEAATERLTTVFDRVTDGVVAMDSSFRYTYANAVAERLLDTPAEELIGHRAWDVFPQLDETAFGPALRRSMAEQEPETVEDRWGPQDAWFYVRVYPAEDGISVYFQDVTDRKARERELATERERYRQLVETAPVGIAGYDDSGTIVYANGAAAELLGVDDADELVGRPAIGFIHPDDRDRARGRMEQVIEQGRSLPPTEYRLLAATDELRLVTVAAAPMTYDDAPAGQVVVIDITELKDRERLLSELHEAAAAIAASETPAAVYERVVEAAETILDFDLAIVDAVEDDILVPKAVSAEVDQEGYFETTPLDASDNLAARAARTGAPSVVPDLRTSSVVPASQTYRSALTVPIGELGVFQAVAEAPRAFGDVDLEYTELLVAHARETLERLDREAQIEARTRELEGEHARLEAFASLVSHDLQNPLNVIAGRLDLARDRRDSEDLAAASRALGRVFALIEELLAIANGERPPMAVEPVRLDSAVETCWQHVETADARLDIATRQVITADVARLHHLLENLLANAIEHGGDAVTVTVGETGDGFYVEDDGVGIPPADRESVFERSYSTGTGTGAGLGFVKQVADAHDWTVTIAESAAGGARFEFGAVAVDDRDGTAESGADDMA